MDSGANVDRIRVVIGDDHDGYRRELRELLAAQPDIEVVGEADDGALALQLVRWLRPNIALLDESMPTLGGDALARVLASELPDVSVVVLTAPRAELSCAKP